MKETHEKKHNYEESERERLGYQRDTKSLPTISQAIFTIEKETLIP